MVSDISPITAGLTDRVSGTKIRITKKQTIALVTLLFKLGQDCPYHASLRSSVLMQCWVAQYAHYACCTNYTRPLPSPRSKSGVSVYNFEERMKWKPCVWSRKEKKLQEKQSGSLVSEFHVSR